MKKKSAYTPALNDQLEDRVVLSLVAPTVHAAALSPVHAAAASPVHAAAESERKSPKLSTKALVARDFTAFETKLKAEETAPKGTKAATFKALVIKDVNSLGTQLLKDIGSKGSHSTLIRQTITGAPDPNGITFQSGASKGSLLAALTAKKIDIDAATTKAEVAILVAI